jgi:aminoglycoside phosphotransferase (APT) family kinase protein
MDDSKIDVALAQKLVATQFPQWEELSVNRLTSAGTDHALFGLGNAMLIRLPKRLSAASQIEKEHFWLPKLAPHVTTASISIPSPIAKGASDGSFPWSWGIYAWIDGESMDTARVANTQQLANDLANFVVMMRNAPHDGTPIAPDNMMRGQPLALRDATTCQSIQALSDEINMPLAMKVWQHALSAPPWRDTPRWVHGDLLPGNLLVRDGRLCAVIDFGGARVGDPAVDAMPAWTSFNAETRTIFRHAIEVSDATWNRARGWALSWAVIALACYRESTSPLSDIARYTIREVLAEHGASWALASSGVS